MIHSSVKSESIAFGVAGIIFGLIAGWVIGAQQAQQLPRPAPAAVQGDASSGAAPASNAAAPAAKAIDEAQVKSLTEAASREPNNAAPRTQLGNLYFDAERYSDAIKWYTEAVALSPNDANLSTDLGVSYYYTNQPDKAIARFDESLKLNPKHVKTLLNLGIVRAFGKQDLAGATKAWEQVLAIDPNGAEGQAAKRALDTLKSAHGNVGDKPGA